MAAKSKYFSFRGKVGLRKRTNCIAGGIVWRGNMPKLVLKIDADVLKHYESSSGFDTQDAQMTRKKAVSADATMEEITAENTDMLLGGVTGDIGGDTLTNFSLGTVVVDDEIWLGKYGLGTVTVKDSASTPVVVDPSKYTVDKDFGSLVFHDVTGYTMPLTISCTTAVSKATTIASSFDDEYEMVFKGVNVYSGEKVVIELWRVVKSPKSELGLINDGFGSYDVTFDCLSDLDKFGVDPELGMFGRFIRVGTAIVG